MSDRIALTGLRVRGHHGVLEPERRDGQEFVVDAVLWLDSRPAAGSDALADTVDYGALADELAAVVAGRPVNLIETLAARLAEVCLRDPRVTATEVTVHKPAAPIPHRFADVAVTVRRGRGGVAVEPAAWTEPGAVAVEPAAEAAVGLAAAVEPGPGMLVESAPEAVDERAAAPAAAVETGRWADRIRR